MKKEPQQFVSGGVTLTVYSKTDFISEFCRRRKGFDPVALTFKMQTGKGLKWEDKKSEVFEHTVDFLLRDQKHDMLCHPIHKTMTLVCSDMSEALKIFTRPKGLCERPIDEYVSDLYIVQALAAESFPQKRKSFLSLFKPGIL